MNAQFSRNADPMIHFAPYLAAMRGSRTRTIMPVFHRYGLMRHWVESGTLDRRHEEGAPPAAPGSDCLSHAVAEFGPRAAQHLKRPGTGRRP